MRAFLLNVSTWCVAVIFFAIVLPLMNGYNVATDDIYSVGFAVMLLIALMWLVGLVLALVGLYRRRQRAWNMAALGLTLLLFFVLAMA